MAWVSVYGDPEYSDGGTLYAQCDPTGHVRLPLYGGLLLCESTVDDLLSAWGPPDSTVKDGYYAACFDGEEYALAFDVDGYGNPPFGSNQLGTPTSGVLTGIGIFWWADYVAC